MIASDCISFNTSLLCFASAPGDVTVKYKPRATSSNIRISPAIDRGWMTS